MADLKDLEAIVKRIETVTERLESAAKGEVTEEISNIGDNVRAFDDIYGGTFKTFFTLSHELGSPEVSSIADLLDKALKAQREFLLIASRSKRPEDQNLAILIKPTGDLIKQIQDYREGQRTSPYFHHLSAVASSAPALGWVVVSPAPAPFLKEIANAGEFYTNRVLREWKEKRTGTQHMEWVQALFWFHNELQDYVKQFHTTGLVWNQTGGDAMQMAASNGKAAPPPPPPPSAPLPPPPPPPRTTSKPPAADARDELMGKLNSGEDVAKDLKKVSDEEKNHKNPALRSDGLVKAKNVAPTAKKAEAKPPKKELDGRKWNIEFFLDDPSIIVEETDPSQSVYVYKCEGSTIQVKGKVNNIVLDQCKKTGLLFESVISSIEVINCRSVQMQALGAVPSISVDKTDGCQIYLSAESTHVEIVTSTSSEMNVLIPGEDGFVERPIPEQFSSRIKDGVLVTVPTSHEIDLE